MRKLNWNFPKLAFVSVGVFFHEVFFANHYLTFIDLKMPRLLFPLVGKQSKFLIFGKYNPAEEYMLAKPGI